MMNQSKRWVTVLLLAAGALTFGASAATGGEHAHRGGHSGMGHFGPGGGRMGMMRGLHGLDLSAEQRDTIHGVMESYRDPLRASAERLRALRGTVAQITQVNTLDEAALSEVADQIGAETATMVGIRGHIGVEVYALLTPEQRQQLAQRGQP